jgi:hypothetical protein
MFVEFILDQHENIQEAWILTRGGTEEATTVTVKIVVEKLTTESFLTQRPKARTDCLSQ